MRPPYKRISIDKYGRISLTERGSGGETEPTTTTERKHAGNKPSISHKCPEDKDKILKNKHASRRTWSSESNCSIFNKLHKRAEKIKFRKKAQIAQKTRLKAKNEMRECTFKPKTFKTLNSSCSRVKSQISTKRNKNKNLIVSRSESTTIRKKTVSVDKIRKVCERLHSNSKIIEARKEKLKIETMRQNCPFKPEINSSTKPKIESFFKRLHSWCVKSSQNKKKLREQAKYDKETKQPLFSPVISEYRPLGPDSHKKANSLYLLHNTRNRVKAEKQLIQGKSFTQMANKKLVDSNSEKIYWKMVEKALGAVFSKFAKNGKISKSCANILKDKNEINDVLKGVLSNILVQLGEIEIDREEFVFVGKSVFKVCL